MGDAATNAHWRQWESHAVAYLTELESRRYSQSRLIHVRRTIELLMLYLKEAHHIADWRAVNDSHLRGFAVFATRRRTSKGKYVSPDTLRQWLSCLRGFFAWMNESGRLVHDPAERLQIPRKTGTLPHVLSESQIAELIETADKSGLDYFGARYYSSAQGRFTSVDPHNVILEAQATAEVSPQKAKAQFLNYLSAPQQWNRYSYVANNPLVYIDPTGEILELNGTEEERKRSFERVKELVGAKAAGSLYVREENGRYFVETKNASAVDASGKLGVIVNDIIPSSTTVQFRVSNTSITQNAAGARSGGVVSAASARGRAFESHS